jgi:MoxR-like ATPase
VIPTEAEAASAAERLRALRGALTAVLFGQEELVDRVVVALVSSGHVLLEGLPGLGKTELVKALGKAVRLEARRIQFTPDLLPGDVTGNPVLQEEDGRRTFVFRKGPIFGNLVLADEINRASPKTQSALLEAMQERSVTVMGETHALPEPFFVLATQNPIELEGTYPLPEAQLDRFLFKLDVRAGGADVLERIVLERRIGVSPEVEPVIDAAELVRLQELARRIHMPKALASYIARLVDATHPGRSTASAGVRWGASPRAALALAAAARAKALLEGRIHAGFDDVRAAAVPVLAHRLVLDYAARLDGLTGAGIVERVLVAVSPAEKPLPPLLREEPAVG